MHNSRTHAHSPPSDAPSRALCPVVCSRASFGTRAFVQVAGASLVQIDVVRACDGGTRTVRVEVDGTGVPCHVLSLANCTRACGSSVVAGLLPNQAKLRVAILGFGLRVFVVPFLLLRVATAYVMGTRGYSMHASSWYRVGTFFRSGYPVAVDARMLQRHMREPAARAVWCRLSGHNSASSSAA
jgi:hypothetical protein